MPLSMKIQPIDSSDHPPPPPPAAATAVRSRLRRLFRISAAAEPPAGELFEPSSVCLAKMVQNFIEENNEKPPSTSPAVRCGRNRCNCFNGNGNSDGEDGESDNISPSDVCEFVKSMVMCVSVNERNVLADTTKIVCEKSKTCKRKDELRKVVTEGLTSFGYDAAICKSKWDKSPSFPAGEYEYVDVIIGGERLIIDIDFRSEFEVARSTKAYRSILQTLPQIFVGKCDRLSRIICMLSESARQSLKKKGMHIPPWRTADYIQAKWLSPPTRLGGGGRPISTPPPSPLSPVGSCPLAGLGSSLGFKVPGSSLDHVAPDEPSGSSPSPTRFEPVFEMSEGEGEEDAKVEVVVVSPKKVVPSICGVKTLNGLASIIEDK